MTTDDQLFFCARGGDVEQALIFGVVFRLFAQARQAVDDGMRAVGVREIDLQAELIVEQRI